MNYRGCSITLKRDREILIALISIEGAIAPIRVASLPNESEAEFINRCKAKIDGMTSETLNQG